MTMSYDVLVVGAGPAGLATALSATRHGAHVLVVERHPGPSTHPRAIGVTTRSMELFRSWGLAEAVRAASIDALPAVVGTRTLADPARTPAPTAYPTPREALAVSPTWPAVCPQDHIEPLLVEQVRRHGGEVRFDTELSDLHADPGGVAAELTHRLGGAVRSIRARYVVGADGPRSTVRAALGIGVEELGTLGEHVGMLFRADLDAIAGEPSYALYSIEHPDVGGLLVCAGAGRWIYARQWFPERGEALADFSPARWVDLIRAATGAPDLRPELLSAQAFTLTAAVATALRSGPGFLVGDAAHRMTPVGGVGMNTALHAAHNLGWKLAWAARGWAGEALLDSYAEERRPVGLRNVLLSLRPDVPNPAGGLAGDLGVIYRSGVIVEAEAVPTTPLAPSARPGQRAPHRWVELHGRRLSTLDLFDGRLTLLVGKDGTGWVSAVAVARARADVPLAALVTGRELTDQTGELDRSYQLGASGAVLVRPDGYVAWCCEAIPADPVGALTGAVDGAMGQTTSTAALAG